MNFSFFVPTGDAPNFVEQLEAFSLQIAAHLTRQRAVAQDEFETCRYRDGERMCAVGCLILDQYYNAELEGYDISNTDVLSQMVLPSMFGVTELADATQEGMVESMLSQWQTYHDGFCAVGNTERYSTWIEGGDFCTSPQEMHEIIMESIRNYTRVEPQPADNGCGCLCAL